MRANHPVPCIRSRSALRRDASFRCVEWGERRVVWAVGLCFAATSNWCWGQLIVSEMLCKRMTFSRIQLTWPPPPSISQIMWPLHIWTNTGGINKSPGKIANVSKAVSDSLVIHRYIYHVLKTATENTGSRRGSCTLFSALNLCDSYGCNSLGLCHSGCCTNTLILWEWFNLYPPALIPSVGD